MSALEYSTSSQHCTVPRNLLSFESVTSPIDYNLCESILPVMVVEKMQESVTSLVDKNDNISLLVKQIQCVVNSWNNLPLEVVSAHSVRFFQVKVG